MSKKKICAFLLGVSLLVTQTVPSFAEDLDSYEAENEVAIEQVNDSTEAVIEEGETNDDSVDEEIIEETESIDSADEQVIDIEDESLEETSVIDCYEASGEELEMVSPQALASGDSISSAINLSIGTKYSGGLTSTKKINYYKFAISSSGRITLTASAGMQSINYYIYDSSGNEIWRKWQDWNRTTELISTNTTIDLTKGTYYFAIQREYSDGNYSFKLDFNSADESFTETGSGSNNAMNSASAVDVNVNYNGQLAVNDDKDFYKFTLSSSGRITLIVNARIESVMLLYV